jgi:hypothetical protein
MPLINGRGQLGDELACSSVMFSSIDLYHTWNFLDKSEEAQNVEFNKLKNYLTNKSNDNKIIFISTSVENDTPYLKYKRLSENLILNSNDKNLVIRFPNIVGKGVFTKLCKNLQKPYGVIEFISLKEAKTFLVDNINKNGIVTCPGSKVPAETIVEIINLVKKLNLN